MIQASIVLTAAFSDPLRVHIDLLDTWNPLNFRQVRSLFIHI